MRAFREFAGGTVPVVGEEYAAIFLQAVSYQRPEGLKALERHVREPETDEDHVSIGWSGTQPNRSA